MADEFQSKNKYQGIQLYSKFLTDSNFFKQLPEFGQNTSHTILQIANKHKCVISLISYLSKTKSILCSGVIFCPNSTTKSGTK